MANASYLMPSNALKCDIMFSSCGPHVVNPYSNLFYSMSDVLIYGNELNLKG